MAIIFGTIGPDNLMGTFFNDQIFAAPLFQSTLDKGSDTVTGGPGNDQIFTYGGTDLAFGAPGNDTIHGGPGKDTVQGGIDNDLLKGEADDDTLFGEDGSDNITGGDGNDAIDGGTGSDILFGEAGNDSLFGGDQDDNLIGGAGDDTLFGQSGLDFLNGGSGINTVWGEGSHNLPAADTFGFYTHNGTGTEYATGTNRTTVRDYKAGQDELYFGDVWYADGTKVTNADTTGNGTVNSADKGWSVAATTSGSELRFAGWNHELVLSGKTSISATDIRIETGSPILLARP
jgi:Ca2+-binding RTX toxin-like protein